MFYTQAVHEIPWRILLIFLGKTRIFGPSCLRITSRTHEVIPCSTSSSLKRTLGLWNPFFRSAMPIFLGYLEYNKLSAIPPMPWPIWKISQEPTTLGLGHNQPLTALETRNIVTNQSTNINTRRLGASTAAFASLPSCKDRMSWWMPRKKRPART